MLQRLTIFSCQTALVPKSSSDVLICVPFLFIKSLMIALIASAGMRKSPIRPAEELISLSE